MMSIGDIVQLMVLCALIFIPLGYVAHRAVRRVMRTIRPLLFRPRYLKPAGVLRRGSSVKAKQRDDE